MAEGCGFQLLTFGRRKVLRLACDTCGRGGDPEVVEDCLEGLLNGLAEVPEAEAVLLPGVYEKEYEGRGLEGLRRLALLLWDWRLRALLRTDRGCGRCGEERRRRLRSLCSALARSPRRAWELLEVWLREEAGKRAGRCSPCRSSFICSFLRPMREELERVLAEVFPGGRMVRPRLRPSFMFCRLETDPPAGAELVERYGLEGGEVRIYRQPSSCQFLYFLLPRELSLSPSLTRLLWEVREELLRDPSPLGVDPELARGRVERLAALRMAERAEVLGLTVGREEVLALSRSLARFTVGMGLLELLLSDERVQDLYLDAPPGETPLHLYHQDFEECLTNIYPSEEEVRVLASRLRALSGRPFSEADPILEAEWGGVRFTLIGPPLSPEGRALSLRRHRSSPWTLPQFVKEGFVDVPTASLLSLLVDGQASLLLAGARGSGKTSLLTALLLELPPKFRLLLLEDTPELPSAFLRSLGFKVQSLRTRSPLARSEREPPAEEALRAALRLGESVLVVGEVRGPEARTLFEAMRVGAAGNCVMGTIHGSSAEEVFRRVVHDLGVPPSSFSSVDAVVVSSPLRPLGGLRRRRRVAEVVEVLKGGGFRRLVGYEVKRDRFVLDLRGSELLRSLAGRWGMGPRELLSLWRLRQELLGALLREGRNRREVLEAPFVFRANQEFRSLWEEEVEGGRPRPDRVRERWREWLRRSLR